MSQFKYSFTFSEDATHKIEGSIELAEPLPYKHHAWRRFFPYWKVGH